MMNLITKVTMVCLLTLSFSLATAQNDDSFENEYQMKTLLSGKSLRGSGGYGAIGNKFTRINGQFANLAEVYGGWYINHKFLLGVEAAAATNDIPVEPEFSSLPGFNMSYEYGQVGLMTEYTLWPDRAIHLSFNIVNGAGFTVQYLRSTWEDDDNWEDFYDYNHESNWFFITEPGIQVEMNLLKWLRFSPGISYRAAFGSNAKGLSDNDISGMSVNATLKFGRF